LPAPKALDQRDCPAQPFKQALTAASGELPTPGPSDRAPRSAQSESAGGQPAGHSLAASWRVKV